MRSKLYVLPFTVSQAKLFFAANCSTVFVVQLTPFTWLFFRIKRALNSGQVTIVVFRFNETVTIAKRRDHPSKCLPLRENSLLGVLCCFAFGEVINALVEPYTRAGCKNT